MGTGGGCVQPSSQCWAASTVGQQLLLLGAKSGLHHWSAASPTLVQWISGLGSGHCRALGLRVSPSFGPGA